MLTRRTLLAAGAASAIVPFEATWHTAAATPKGVFVMAKQIDDVISFDPAQAYEFTNGECDANCYARLVRPDTKDHNRVAPDLATSWEVSKDGKEFTFHLGNTQKFATGRVADAHDVAFSFQRAVKLNLTPGFIITQFGFTKDNCEQLITAVDARTFKLMMPKVQATSFVLFCLSATIGSIVDRETAMKHDVNGDLGNKWLTGTSAGSGAYQLTKWAASDSIILDANPHAEVKPFNRRVVIKHTPEPSAQLLALEHGDADVARDLTSELLQKAKTNKAFHISKSGQGSINYLGLNCANPHFAKIEVREAFKWALDYDSIVNNIVPNIYEVSQSFLPVGLPGALPNNPFKRDVAKAKELMAKAGYADGFEVTMDHFNSAPYTDIAQAVQANLKDIGVKLNLLPAEKKQVYTKMRNRTFDIVMSGWATDFFDPHSNAQAFCANPDDSDNSKLKILAWRCHFHDPELTKMVDDAVVELDSKKRLDIYRRMQELSNQRSPFIFMMQPISTAVMAKGVSGFVMGPVFDDTRYAKVKKA
jgi:peptide/nickel transport system substrate-binding protein